jgi:hypothetical protein
MSWSDSPTDFLETGLDFDERLKYPKNIKAENPGYIGMKQWWLHIFLIR